MALDPREGLFEFRAFKGLRNNVDPSSFDPGDLEVALDVDIDDAENVLRRKGFSAPVLSGAYHSLFSNGVECFAVVGDALRQMNADYTTRLLRSDLAADRPLSYVSVADRTFYSNGVDTGIAQGGASRTWGMIVPGLPSVLLTGGSLRPGRYQYVLTYLRADGQESGARRAGVVELPAQGGLSFSALPVSPDPNVLLKALYVSQCDGESLYRVAVVANTTTAVDVTDARPLTLALSTQFLSPAPAGEHLGYYKGRVLVGSAGYLRWSEPYSLELFDLRKGVPVIGRITMVAPVDDGVWLGTDEQVIWLPGDEPEKFSFQPRASYGAIPGTLAYGDSELVGGSNNLPVAFFATTQGLCVGTPGGALRNLTEARFQYPATDRGAGVVRRHRGIAQYVAVLHGNMGSVSVAVALYAEASFALPSLALAVELYEAEASFSLPLLTVSAAG